MFEFELDDDNLPVCDINIKEWNSMSSEQQEEYIVVNNIKVKYSTDISDTLSKGFGRLDNWGFWEYQCKQIRYPKFIITFADDVYQFVKENNDGTLCYKTFGGGKLDIKPEEIGVKYRQIK